MSRENYRFYTENPSVGEKIRKIVKENYRRKNSRVSDSENSIDFEFYPFLGRNENVIFEIDYSSGDNPVYAFESSEKFDLVSFLRDEAGIDDVRI